MKAKIILLKLEIYKITTLILSYLKEKQPLIPFLSHLPV